MKRKLLLGLLVFAGLTVNAQITEAEPELNPIIGGDEADAEEFPWMCSIILDIPDPGCGASLIRPQWVLTAAHCELSDFDITSEQVLINSLTLDLDDLQPYSELIDIEEFIVHEDYNSFSGNGPDIALIRLSEASTITPIELAEFVDSDNYEHGDPAQALGWGTTEGGGLSDDLLHTDCRFFNSDTCEAMYSEAAFSYYELNAGGNICAGYFTGESPAGAAQGDSGGPLFFTDGDGATKQVGVVSGGESAITTEEFPGVFTLVAAYVDWIENTIEDYEIAASLAAENRENLNLVYFADDRIEVQGLNQENNYEIGVFDMMGNQVNTEVPIAGNTFNLNVADYTAGMYLIRIVNRSNGNLTVEKFVVR